MLVSIIIPCYNVEACINNTLDSALAQSYHPLEIIAVDNNSTDETHVILKKYERAHPNLIRVFKEAKQGAPAARNTGLKHSRGDWIQYLDADDILEHDKIKNQVALISGKGDSTGFVAAAFYQVGPDGTLTSIYPLPIDPLQALFSSNLGLTSANLFNRKYVKKVGGWKEGLPKNQEYELMFRILMQGAMVVFDNQPSTFKYIRDNSISANTYQKGQLISAKTRAKMLAELRKRHESLSSEDLAFYQGIIFHYLRQHSKLNWNSGYACRKLLHDKYLPRKMPYNRITRWDIWGVRLLNVNGYFNTVYLLYQIWQHLRKLSTLRRFFSAHSKQA